ncbi:MAG: hydantoinase/oxoprolinase family protein [Planctomycetaceae bacterium]
MTSWQFWIDVGGTFTDCIGVSPDGRVVPFKTLSSGLVKGQGRVDAGGTRLIDEDRRADPAGFWNGSRMRIVSGDGRVVSESRITEFAPASGSFKLSEPVTAVGEIRYELDCGLPAPVLAVRWLLNLRPDDDCPPVSVRFGTTRGTNALLTRTGAKTALITTRGFADVPLIGNQTRPDLFDLNIRKPRPLFAQVFEVDERIDANGQVLRSLDEQTESNRLPAAGLSSHRFDSVAICLMNAYRNPLHEEQLEAIVRAMGFTEVSRSTEVSPLIRFVPRCDTTTLDAYLNPVLRTYLQQIQGHLRGSRIQVMTSAGGLVDATAFRGRDCILSGPAGGIVGFAKVAQAEGFDRSIGFDMGGTSTDVARFDGQFEYEHETMKAAVRIMTPVLAIETVAAGGGSICGFDGVRLFVGPDSAGAKPGPACYGSGGPLTVTDLNVLLGRIPVQHFPFPLHVAAIEERLEELLASMNHSRAMTAMTREELAEGLLRIANDNMAHAIRKVSVTKGYHPSDYVLVAFGGAGGQHACSVARRLGIRRVLIHSFAGILSAWGMGQADVRRIRQCSVLKTLSGGLLSELQPLFEQLEAEGRAEVAEQGIAAGQIVKPQRRCNLRYSGTDSTLTVAVEHSATDADIREEFEGTPAAIRISQEGTVD